MKADQESLFVLQLRSDGELIFLQYFTSTNRFSYLGSSAKMVKGGGSKGSQVTVRTWRTPGRIGAP